MALNQFSRTQLSAGSGEHASGGCDRCRFRYRDVGDYTVEALARSGVGHFVLVDDDKVCLTNINRQIIATRGGVGKYKVDVMKERILDINPKAEVETYKCFYLPENAVLFDFTKYSVVDAVDTVTAKDRDHHARQRRATCRSSAVWEPETNWIRRSSVWQIFTRRTCARWQRSCGVR